MHPLIWLFVLFLTVCLQVGTLIFISHLLQAWWMSFVLSWLIVCAVWVHQGTDSRAKMWSSHFRLSCPGSSCSLTLEQVENRTKPLKVQMEDLRATRRLLYLIAEGESSWLCHHRLTGLPQLISAGCYKHPSEGVCIFLPLYLFLGLFPTKSTVMIDLSSNYEKHKRLFIVLCFLGLAGNLESFVV